MLGRREAQRAVGAGEDEQPGHGCCSSILGGGGGWKLYFFFFLFKVVVAHRKWATGKGI